MDKERQTDRTTMMLLAVLLLFLLTELPQGILGLLCVILGTGFLNSCYLMLGEIGMRQQISCKYNTSVQLHRGIAEILAE